MSTYYLLVGKTPVLCDDLMEWARKFNIETRHVATDDIGGAHISTVFLGIDHRFRFGEKEEKLPPLLFETMIFDGVEDGYQRRCCTWEEAEAQHAEAVELVRRATASADKGLAALEREKE